MKKLATVLIVLSLVAAIAFAGGSSESKKDAAADGKYVDMLRIGVASWPKTLDPGRGMGLANVRWLYEVFDTVLYCENDGTISSYICDSWTRIDDCTTEYHLKPGITFHDGSPLTAEDVAYSLMRPFEYRAGYIDANVKTIVNTIDHCEVLDDLTFRIITVQPDPVIFQRLAGYMSVYVISKNYFETQGEEVFATNPIGTGPYKVVELTGESIMLTYYDGYYGEKPIAENVEFCYIPEESALIAAIMTGEIDIAPDLSKTSWDALNGNKDVDIINKHYTASHLCRINCNEEGVPWKEVRQAMSLAIDRQALIDNLWGGMAFVPNGYNYDCFGEYYIEDYPEYEYNPEKAAELVKNSGYDGRVIQYRLVNGYYKMGNEAAEAIVDMWKKVGINAQVTFVDNWTIKGIEGLLTWSNGLRFDDPIGGLWVLWGEGVTLQTHLWHTEGTERFNELGHQLLVETDVQKRRAIYREMMEIWDDEVPGIIWYCPDSIWAIRNDMDWDYQPGKGYNFRADHLKWKES
ncbi:MAG: hypothetical protein J5785_03090 [Spirochaetales bacterium]|nr:hypothetical protein [Spirochaetales bacterium]